jgi:subtilisin
MLRRILPLLLAVLVAFPVVAPAIAAEPSASPPVEPSLPPPAEPPSAEPTASPSTDPTPGPDATASQDSTPASPDPSVDPAPMTTAGDAVVAGAPDPAGRYIVVLRKTADTAAVVAKAGTRNGVKADHKFGKAFKGFSAKLDRKQKSDLLADPNVVALVPDSVISLTQTIPTGVSRVGGRKNAIAAIDGTDHRVDADVAIVDTGISNHPDLNVAGGYNCSTSDPTAWIDKNNHGTHVAGIVGALDNSFGVVGVAPGVRLWAVKILNDSGYGLISWYICGLDWILAQRDPVDPSRPLFEAVNMSVTKYGKDDHDCGYTNDDPLHQAICRVVAGGITVVAAAANDSHNAGLNIPASYNEVITVSALADTDGKPGGLGGNRCYSWGGYDKDDTFADFSNYGGDVDLIAPGKCIMSTITGGNYAYMSGTSMAAPTVTGAVALYKASRPNATPAEVRESLRYLGNLDWKVSTDPDSTHEPLLDVSRIGPLGTFSLTPAAPKTNGEAGTTTTVPFTVGRSATFFERVSLSITSLPAGWTGTLAKTSLMGWTATAGQVSLAIPTGTPLGTYSIGLKGTNQGRTIATTFTVQVVKDDPTATPPWTTYIAGTTLGRTSTLIHVLWAPATDPTSAIAGYELQRSVNDGAWGSTVSMAGTAHMATYTATLDTVYRFRVRAVDAAGNWSAWAVAGTSRFHPFDDRSSRVRRVGTWHPASSSGAYKSTLLGSSKASTSVRMTFTGHSVAVVAQKSPYRGKAKVYLDGAYIKTISTTSSRTYNRQVVFSWFFPGGGTHTISLVPTGTGAHPLFRLDAIAVGR